MGDKLFYPRQWAQQAVPQAQPQSAACPTCAGEGVVQRNVIGKYGRIEQAPRKCFSCKGEKQVDARRVCVHGNWKDACTTCDLARSAERYVQHSAVLKQQFTTPVQPTLNRYALVIATRTFIYIERENREVVLCGSFDMQHISKASIARLWGVLSKLPYSEARHETVWEFQPETG